MSKPVAAWAPRAAVCDKKKSLLAFFAGALAGASVFFLSWAWQPALHSPHSLYSGSVGKVGRFVYVPYLLPFLAVCTTTNFSRRAKIP